MSELPRTTWNLNTTHLGRRTLVYPILPSTNSFAWGFAADPANHGLAILADEQRAGRGQYGRTWTAPPHSSVLLSVLLFPPASLRHAPLLTAWAAVSVCETIRATTNLQAKIKWPNDVLIHGKKVCGILIEQRAAANSETAATVVGIGLNVTQPAQFFADAGLPHGASLHSIAGAPLKPAPVAQELLHRLDEEYGRLVSGDLTTLEAMWKWHLGLLGKRLLVHDRSDGESRGRLLDLTFDAVVLESPKGQIQTFTPELIGKITVEYDNTPG